MQPFQLFQGKAQDHVEYCEAHGFESTRMSLEIMYVGFM